jgi:hypothetical protein
MIKTFKCPNCGATMSYEGGPETTVQCAFCGNTAAVPPELRAQTQPDPMHGFATHTPHPQAAPRRLRVDWSGMNPAVRFWIIILVLIFVALNCIGLAVAMLAFIIPFVAVFISLLAEIFAR